MCSDGDIEEGVSGEASSIAGIAGARQPHGHLRRQPDLDRGRHRHRVHRGRRRALRGLRLARPDRRLDQRRARRTSRTSPRSTTRSSPPGAVTDRPSLHRAAHDHRAGPRPTPRAPRQAHGCALGDEEVAATKKVLGFDPEQTFEVPDDVLEHTRTLRDRGKAAGSRVGRAVRRLGRRPSRSRRRAPATGSGRGRCPTGWADALPDVRRRRQGRRDPRRVRQGDQRDRAADARAVGRLGRPGRLQQHHHRGRAVVPAPGPLHRGVEGRPLRRAACCTSASASTAWARS